MNVVSKISLIGVLMGILVVGASTALWAQPDEMDPEGPPEGEDGPGRLTQEYLRTHMEIGRYYLLAGDYEAAVEHFMVVAEFEPAERPERPERTEAVEGRRGHRGERGQQGRRGRRGHRGPGRAVQARCQAYLMAAVATYLDGDGEAAVALAETGKGLIPEPPENARRRRPRTGGQAIDRFLEDPNTFVERFAGGISGLEERLLEIEGELSDNAAE